MLFVINAYVLQHLELFTVEMLQNHLFCVMITKLLEEIRNKCEEENLRYKYLQIWIDKPPSHTTFSNWRHALKIRYVTEVKSSMVDGHEKQLQKKQRAYLTSEYITAIKPWCHHWVKMSVSNFNKLTDRQEIMNAGYTYTGIDGTPMIEFHVEDNSCFQE